MSHLSYWHNFKSLAMYSVDEVVGKQACSYMACENAKFYSVYRVVNIY